MNEITPPTTETRSLASVNQLYHGDRSEITWTDSDIANLKKTCASDIARAVDRPRSLYRTRAWRPPAGVLAHVGDDTIILTTGKSRHRREVIILLYDAVRRALHGIPKRSTILANGRHRLGTENSFGSAFNRAKIDGGMEDRDLHFSRPPPHRRNPVLHRWFVHTCHRSDHGLGGEIRRKHHPPLRWTPRRNQDGYRTA